MRVREPDDDLANLFLTYSPSAPMSAYIGHTEPSGEPLRITFEAEHGNAMIVGRSKEAALGICVTMLLDLASQIVSTPGRREIYTTPPFSILDFLGTHESRVFTDAAMSLPLPVKLERATDTAMTTLTDFQFELARRQREPQAARHPKFLFLCGLQAAHGVRSRGFYASAELGLHGTKFAELLRHGARWSLYSIVWCNSFANIELTMSNGMSSFDHLIVLDGAGEVPDRYARARVAPADHAWYVEGSTGRTVPFVPVAVPTETWCDAVIRTFA